MANFMLAPGRVDIETFFEKHNAEKEISLLYEVEKKGLRESAGAQYYFSNVDFVMFWSSC